MDNLIELKNVSKEYEFYGNTVDALNKINLSIKKEKIVVILGSSGSGKTTLLNCISGLDRITSGSIYFDGVDISKFSDRKLTKFRKDKLGFIFQNYNLLEHLNVYENILVGASLGKNKDDVSEIMKLLDLTRHRKKPVYKLSGGERQRVSIARAIVKKPAVMFCDEPTGALDEETGKKVLQCLVKINETLKTTFVIITHNPGIALIGDEVIKMNSGKIVEIKENKKRVDPLDIPWG